MNLDNVKYILKRNGSIQLIDFIGLSVDERIAIITAELIELNAIDRDFYSSIYNYPGGLSLENQVFMRRWEDDCDDSEGWCDPYFDGYRMVLSCIYCEPLHQKAFPSREVNQLSYAYLTADNAEEVNTLIEAVGTAPGVSRFLRERFKIN